MIFSLIFINSLFIMTLLRILPQQYFIGLQFRRCMVQNLVRTSHSDVFHYSYMEEVGKVVIITSNYTERKKSFTRVEQQL
jgi:hypothetical protein